MNSLVVDTSAIIALYLGESTAAWVLQQSRNADRLLMSTVNLAECLIILRLRTPCDSEALAQQLISSGIDFIAPDATHATFVADARERFPLNLGDCFAYALAKTHDLPLLTLDRDFRSTDIQAILPPPP